MLVPAQFGSLVAAAEPLMTPQGVPTFQSVPLSGPLLTQPAGGAAAASKASWILRTNASALPSEPVRASFVADSVEIHLVIKARIF